MLTDPEARALLREAAETIDVAPAGPIETESRRPRWPFLAAAAAVIVIATGATALALGTRDEDPQPTSPTPSPTHSPTVSASPQVRVPQLLGLDESEATQVLDDAGLVATVSTTDLAGCQPDHMVVSQRPSAGATAEPGSEVVIEVIENQDDFCGGLPGPG